MTNENNETKAYLENEFLDYIEIDGYSLDHLESIISQIQFDKIEFANLMISKLQTSRIKLKTIIENESDLS